MAAWGLLNLNKPAGATSRDVVNMVQRLVRPAKAGHAGTLDPLATGVLVVGVGAATRLVEYVQRQPKTYTGTFLLGRYSPTEDIEGEVTELPQPVVPTREQLAAAAEKFVGRMEQRPPAYSAIKVAGRRAYKLARKGESVDLPPRPVTIHRLKVEKYVYPELTLEIECGSGTYIRALGRDLAESLGTAAVMSALVRTAIGEFRLEEAVEPGALTRENWASHLLPPAQAAATLRRIVLSAEQVAAVARGLTIVASPHEADAQEIAAVDSAGRLIAILTPRGRGRLGPMRNFPRSA